MSSHSRQHTVYILVPHLRNVLRFLWRTIILGSQLQWPSIASEAGLSRVIQFHTKATIITLEKCGILMTAWHGRSLCARSCPDPCCTFFNITSIHLGSYRAKFLGDITKDGFIMHYNIQRTYSLRYCYTTAITALYECIKEHFDGQNLVSFAKSNLLMRCSGILHTLGFDIAITTSKYTWLFFNRWDGEFPNISFSMLSYMAEFFGQTLGEVVILEKDKPQNNTIEVLESLERRRVALQRCRKLPSKEANESPRRSNQQEGNKAQVKIY